MDEATVCSPVPLLPPRPPLQTNPCFILSGGTVKWHRRRKGRVEHCGGRMERGEGRMVETDVFTRVTGVITPTWQVLMPQRPLRSKTRGLQVEKCPVQCGGVRGVGMRGGGLVSAKDPFYGLERLCVFLRTRPVHTCHYACNLNQCRQSQHVTLEFSYPPFLSPCLLCPSVLCPFFPPLHPYPPPYPKLPYRAGPCRATMPVVGP
ncbi:hypothetical protein GGS20DRAFT_555132 [Poronia punctata]|nr:hypothetical protein GGS20DRAFT_555132 [Poronia punctata]